jgi:excisionase family DNA binding protein
VTDEEKGRRFLTVREVAHELAIHPDEAHAMVRAGVVPSYRFGPRRTRISREDFEAFVEAARVKAG